MARNKQPAAPEPEMIPDKTHGWAGVKPGSIRPWQPVPLGQVRIVVDEDAKQPPVATVSQTQEKEKDPE